MKIRSILVFALTFCISAGMFAQSSGQDTWKTLAKITYKKQYDELMGFDVDVPVFSEAIQELEGKEVLVEGYIVPVDGYKTQEHFVFSAYPYNMCFFCGGAGKETVMEVFSTDPKMDFTSAKITIRGKIETNDSDINSLMYILRDAVLVEGDEN